MPLLFLWDVEEGATDGWGEWGESEMLKGRGVRLEDGAYGGRNAQWSEKGLCGRGAAKQMKGKQAMKYIADFLVRDVLKMPAEKTRTVYAPEVKRKVLAYFARFEAVAFTSAPVLDAFTGEIVGDAMNGCSDGEYRWYLDEVYHFDKYDMKLSDDFIEHVMRAS